jgi:O-antigen/teichoic acid export membrane protein
MRSHVPVNGNTGIEATAATRHPSRRWGRASLQVPLWSVIQAGVQMGIALLSARWLGPADRGDLVLATTMGSLLLLINSVGTGAASRVVLAEPGRWWTWSRYLRLAAVLTVPHVAFCATVGVAVLSLLSSSDTSVHLAFILYSATALNAHLVREGLHGLGKHRASVVTDVGAAAVQLALIGTAYAAHLYSPATALVIASLCFAGAITTGSLIGTRADAYGRGVPRGSAREWWHRAGEFLGFSRLALVAAVGQTFVFTGDRLILGALGHAEQVGIYSAASTLASLSGMAPLALTALITRKTAERGTLLTWHRTHVPVLAVTAATATAVAVVGWFAIPILLGDEFLTARTLLPVFCAAMVPYASYYFDSAACAGLRDLRTGAMAALTGCLTLVPCAAIGYLVSGTRGVAAGVLVTYTVMAVIARTRLRRAAPDQDQDGPLTPMARAVPPRSVRRRLRLAARPRKG